MNASELREKNPAELEESLLELRKEQFNLRMQQGTGQLARPSEMRRVRKEIARMKTVLNELKSGEAK
jgi:large subunit ribosomal protein L29